MPQGSSAWVWISIATTSSMLGISSFGILASIDRGAAFCKLIILYNEFGKPSCNPDPTILCLQRSDVRFYRRRPGTRPAGGEGTDGAGGRLRDRLLEACQFAESLGRHRSRRAAPDDSLHPDAGSDCAVLQGGRRRSPCLFR